MDWRPTPDPQTEKVVQRLNHIWAYIERWADNIPSQGCRDEGLALTVSGKHLLIKYNGKHLARIDNGMTRNLHVVTKEVCAIAFALSNYCEAIA